MQNNPATSFSFQRQRPGQLVGISGLLGPQHMWKKGRHQTKRLSGQLALPALEPGAIPGSTCVEVLMGDCDLQQSSQTLLLTHCKACSLWGSNGGTGGDNGTKETFDTRFLGRQTVLGHSWELFCRRQKEKKKKTGETAAAFIAAVHSPAEYSNI